MKPLPATLALALAAAAAGSAAAQSAAVVPLAEHHAHLLSPVTAAMAAVPALPVVPLPGDLAAVLAERSRVWNDAAGLAGLYAEDVILFNSDNSDLPSWVRGRKAASDSMAGLFGRAYRIAPVAYRVDGDTAVIAGYFARDIETGVRNFGHTLLTLRKAGGRWLIVAEAPVFPGPTTRAVFDADKLVAMMDAAGTRKAAILSLGYWFGSPLSPPVADEYAKVTAENDWTAAQAARHPDRLVALCGVNPLKDYAVGEVARCVGLKAVKGIKLHLGNSGVDLRKPDHAAKVRLVLREANRRGLALVIHMWTAPAYETEGADHARVLLELLSETPDVTVQIAHMAGGGRSTEPALEVFAKAIEARDPRTRRLYFDVATLTAGQSDEGLAGDAARMRRIGLDRILFGTDLSPPNPSIRESWNTFRIRMPLTDAEIRDIADNVAPYLK